MNAAGQRTLIGIGESAISDTPGDLLVAPNLGSCLGVAVFDPVTRCGAMAHFLLPLSKSNPEKAAAQPCMFVDTGLLFLLNQIIDRGADIKRLVLAVAGGSNINDANNVFEIGKKNYTVLRKMVWKNNILIRGEHIGDNVSRTIALDVGTGSVTVKVSGETIVLV